MTGDVFPDKKQSTQRGSLKDAPSDIGGMSDEKSPPEFASVDHLSADALAAFVDDELSRGAEQRAKQHLLLCAECREEVYRQRRMGEWLRARCVSNVLAVPEDLMAKLQSIASECEPGPGAEEKAIKRPNNFVAKVESVVRAVRRTQQH